jgi:Ca2+-binding RTX toxin-like protein
MALVSPLNSVTSQGTALSLGTADDLYLSSDIYIASAATAVFGSGSGQEVVVDGRIYGATAAVFLGDDPVTDVNNTVSVSAGGALITTGLAALLMFGAGARVLNYGRIDGIGIASGGPAASTITNSGTIEGRDYGINCVGAGEMRLINHGIIRAPNAAYQTNSTASDVITNTGLMDGRIDLFEGSNSVTNEGTVRGEIRGGTGADQVTNAGTVTGALSLGGGSNTVTNTGTLSAGISGGGGADTVTNSGRIFDTIDLGDGTNSYFGLRGIDTGETLSISDGTGFTQYFLGAARENISGGGGTDWLNLTQATRGATVFVNTAGTNGGWCAGDTFAGIDAVFATRFADRITGGAGAEELVSGSGTDTVSGGRGADIINGGAGRDRLTGGLGNDRFVFSAISEGGDVITDFGNATNNNDRISVAATFFGGGLVAGAAVTADQFLSRADNRAQDAEDRFIFRTTDRTVWFDANGNAAGGPVLIADLQAGAVFTAADILLA